MATGKVLEFVIGLVIVVLVFITIGGCVSNYLNPKCDLRVSNTFDEFVKLYTKCMNINEDNVCKCGDFKINQNKLVPENKIIVSPSLSDIDSENKIRFSLFCNNRNAKNKILNDKLRVYFPKEEKIDEEILGGGFELEAILREEGFMQGFFLSKEIPSFLYSETSKNPNEYTLTLVNYKGEVAFMERTKSQLKFLEENELGDCQGKII